MKHKDGWIAIIVSVSYNMGIKNFKFKVKHKNGWIAIIVSVSYNMGIMKKNKIWLK